MTDPTPADNQPTEQPEKPEAVETGEPVADMAELTARIAELEQAFDLRWNADQRAIKRWQEANPGNDLVWPDHADLCVWLLNERINAPVSDGEARRKALSAAGSWLNGWAVHAGGCRGGHLCECGLTRIRDEVNRALAAIPTAGDATDPQPPKRQRGET